MTNLLDAALAYAEMGLRVFPLIPGDKKPAIKNWPELATDDPKQIRTWWAKWPSANIGIATGPSGLLVVDLDVKDGHNGPEAWAALTAGWDVPPTAKASTPSGGVHLYFTAPDQCEIGNSAGKIGDGIDVRAQRGFIVAPPSRTPDGAYEWLHPLKDGIATAPPELCALLAKPDPRPASEARPLDRDITPYLKAALERAADAVRHAEQGRRNQTLNKEVHSLAGLCHAGLSEDAITSEMVGAGLACGLPDHEVRATVGAAIRSGQEHPRQIPEGHDEMQRASEVFASNLSPQEKRHILTGMIKTLPTTDPEWQYTNILEHEEVPEPLFRNGPVPGTLANLYGESGIGKFWTAATFGLTVALGRTLLPTFAAGIPGGVVYLSYEDRAPLVRWRLRAIGDHFGIPWGDVVRVLQEGRLRFSCDIPGPLFEQSGRGSLPTPTPLYKGFVRQLEQDRPKLIVIDPFSAMAELEEENSARPVHGVAAALSTLAERIGAVVLLPHHTSKARAAEGSQHAGRGSSALSARARWIANLTPVRGEGDAGTTDVIELAISKNSYARPVDPVWLRRADNGVLCETVRLGGRATVSGETIVRTICEWLTEHADAVVSVTMIAKDRGDGPELFQALKQEFGTGVTKSSLREAIKAGISAGLLREEAIEIRGGKTFRLVPTGGGE